MSFYGRNCVSVSFNGMTISLVEEEWNKVSPKNQSTIMEFDRHSKRIGLEDTTRTNDIKTLIRFAKAIDKPFKSLTKEDINNYFDSLNVMNTSKIAYLHVLCKFFKWLKKKHILNDVINMKGDSKRIKASDLISEEEMQKLIDYYQNPCEKALIAVLGDSACRIGEIAGLKRRDVTCTNGQWTISVTGKTGVRTVPLMFSPQYLRPWYDELHPCKDPDAPLWISRSSRFSKEVCHPLSSNAIWRICKKGEKVIKKHINPHLFRHSRLSSLGTRGLPEFMMREYAGWEPNSTMPAIYLHTDNKKVAEKIKSIETPEQPMSAPKNSSLIPIICPRCQIENSPSSHYCKRCWLPLDINTSMEEIKVIELLRSRWYSDIQQDIKRLERQGYKIPYEQIEIGNLASTFEKLRNMAKNH